MRGLIIGHGEEGKRIGKIINEGYPGNTYWKDLGPEIEKYDCSNDNTIEYHTPKMDVLHICYIYNKEFQISVADYIKQYKPKLVVIWSSIGPMACESIQKIVGNKFNIVHCPLFILELSIPDSVRACDQMMGYDTIEAKEMGIGYLKQCFKIFPVKGTRTVALGKILSTTQYALGVAFNQEMERICKAVGADYNMAVREVTRLYNSGYKKLGLDQYIRQLLFPGIIGGHCQIENAKTIQQFYSSEFLDMIMKSNEKYTKEGGA